MKNKKKNIAIQTSFLFLSLLLVAALSWIGTTAGRYIIQKQEKQLVEPQNFFFSSNLLREEKDIYYFLDPSTETFQIQLCNYESMNKLRFTSSDIRYTVEVTHGTGNGENNTLTGGVASEQSLTITPNKDTESVIVTVSATSPYTKTLSAEFRFAQGNQYWIEDAVGNTAAVLTIISADTGGSILLSLPEGITPDATDTRIYKEEAGVFFRSPGMGIYSLVLIKEDRNQNYSKMETAFANTIKFEK